MEFLGGLTASCQGRVGMNTSGKAAKSLRD